MLSWFTKVFPTTHSFAVYELNFIKCSEIVYLKWGPCSPVGSLGANLWEPRAEAFLLSK